MKCEHYTGERKLSEKEAWIGQSRGEQHKKSVCAALSADDEAGPNYFIQ